MNKLSITLNDYYSNVKSIISFDTSDIDMAESKWEEVDERLQRLNSIPEFEGYDRWCDLTPEHYRVMITRLLNELAKLTAMERRDTENTIVSACNYVVLCFIIAIENRTSSQVEHFRINRFSELDVSFDYSATFELTYNKPVGKSKPSNLSIVIDNTDENS